MVEMCGVGVRVLEVFFVVFLVLVILVVVCVEGWIKHYGCGL